MEFLNFFIHKNSPGASRALLSYFLALLLSLTFVHSQNLIPRPWPEVTAQFGANARTVFGSTGPGTPDDFNVTLHWRIENQGKLNEQLHMALGIVTPFVNTPVAQIPTKVLFWPYIAIGFGRSMVQGNDFVTCETNGKFTQTFINERRGTKKYGPPEINSDVPIIEKISGGFLNGVFYCEFKRFTNPPSSNGKYASINVNSPQPMIWAFNPAPVQSVSGDYFTYHGENRRGYLLIALAAGSVTTNAGVSFANKQIHGFGMMIVWMVVFPAAVLWSRYLRSVPNWLFVHMGIQVVGSSAVLGFLAVIGATVIGFDGTRPHSIFGVILIAGLILQVALGVVNLLGMSQESLYRTREKLRYIHAILGLFLLVGSVVTVGLGLDQLYPFANKEDRGVEFWYAYFLVGSFWIATYLFLEFFFRLKIRNVDKKKEDREKMPVDSLAWSMIPRKKSGSASKKSSRTSAATAIDSMDSVAVVKNSSVQSKIVNTTIPLNINSRQNLQRYSWDTLDKQVQQGKLLVVGNGKYVYDISRWIISHPGGQTILLTVAGTDISNDYWHEAGFDAADFTPAQTPLVQKPSRTAATSDILRQRTGTTFSDRSSYTGSITTEIRGALTNRDSIQAQMQATPGLTEADWKRIIKARRTHVHTQLALKRLAQLVVGEILPSSTGNELGPRQYFDNPLGRTFSRYEYRRYAITEKKLVTSGGSSESAKPVYRLRFCLLYPHDVRDQEPVDGFLPGECLEIQVRTNKTSVVSRYYTPVSGNMTAFEINVKVIPNGIVSRLLARQKPGDRQIKIRGPFGAPLLAPHKPLSTYETSQWVPETIIMFAAGSGVTPFLQLIQYLLLPLWEPITAISDYQATINDELTIRRGDVLLTKTHYFDGWAVGHNVSTNQSGFFPLSVTLPRVGIHYRTRILLINSIPSFDDIFGMDVMEGSLLAYPQLVNIQHFVETGFAAAEQAAAINLDDLTAKNPRTNTSQKVVELPCGVVNDGVLTDEKIQQLVEPLFAGEETGRVFVCGPPMYESSIVDSLAEIGIHGEMVRILPHDRWVENI